MQTISDVLRKAGRWVANEALSISGVVIGLLVVTGHLTPDDAEKWAEWAAGLAALLGTLVVRGGIDGPMTRRENNRTTSGP